MQAPDSAPAQAAANTCRMVFWSGADYLFKPEWQQKSVQETGCLLTIDEMVMAGLCSVLHGTRIREVAFRDDQ